MSDQVHRFEYVSQRAAGNDQRSKAQLSKLWRDQRILGVGESDKIGPQTYDLLEITVFPPANVRQQLRRGWIGAVIGNRHNLIESAYPEEDLGNVRGS